MTKKELKSLSVFLQSLPNQTRLNETQKSQINEFTLLIEETIAKYNKENLTKILSLGGSIAGIAKVLVEYFTNN
jgi:hypothetical protein